MARRFLALCISALFALGVVALAVHGSPTRLDASAALPASAASPSSVVTARNYRPAAPRAPAPKRPAAKGTAAVKRRAAVPVAPARHVATRSVAPVRHPPTTVAHPAPTVPRPAYVVSAASSSCAQAVAYLAAHAAPGFAVECPGYADGRQAMTCWNIPGLCPGQKVIILSVVCPASWMNEASNSWVIVHLADTVIDPYGSCP